jgi:cyclophilin family peptidyl-prolyl cis-trans isomerase
MPRARKSAKARAKARPARPRTRAKPATRRRAAKPASGRRAAKPGRSPKPARSALGHQARRILAIAAAFASGCGSEPPAPDPAAEALARVAEGPHEVAVLSMGDLGEIRIELLPELAPATVEHWKALATAGEFDGTTFHRVIPGFMIQGGDPLSRNHDPRDDGRGGSEVTVADEFTALPQRRGTVSMANKGQRNTAGSQFFILQRDAPHLDGHFTAFGRVVAGMDVVDAITRLEIDKYGRYGPRDRPYPRSATIESVRILAAGEAVGAPGVAAAASVAGAAATPVAPDAPAGYPEPPVAR